MPLLGSACKAAIEGFAGTSEDPTKRKAIFTELLATLLAFVIALVILGFVGKLLWNNVVIELFSFAKPARSFWQILGLMIFVSLVNP
jgi:hypothetical protein